MVPVYSGLVPVYSGLVPMYSGLVPVPVYSGLVPVPVYSGLVPVTAELYWPGPRYRRAILAWSRITAKYPSPAARKR